MAQVGNVISVLASYIDGASHEESVTSIAVTPQVQNVNDLPTGEVVIGGSAVVGRQLTATSTLADLDGVGAISYQWNAAGTGIAGATGCQLH